MKEIEQAFDVADFPVLDAFHPFHPHNVPDKPLPSFGQEEAEIIFKHYGNSKVDILENIRKEGAPIIKCSKENFLVEARRYFESVAEKNIHSKADTEEKLKVAKRRLLEMEKNKKNMARNLKLHQHEVDSLTDKMTQLISLNEAFLLVEEVFPSIATLLQLIQVCPASGAIVKQGFSLMNLVMNDLRNSMNIATLDAMMRITYVNEITDDVVEKIIGIWKRRENRRIEI